MDKEDDFSSRGKRLTQQIDWEADLLDDLRHLTGPARIAALAAHVWDAGFDAETFLNGPHLLLGSLTPLEAAKTQAGAQQIEDILWRIVFGISV